MAENRTRALEALLGQAERAHGDYEAMELDGVYDADWPRWYAAYAVEHGIGGIIGRDVTADEVAEIFSAAWEDFQRADPKPTESWSALTARQIVENP